MQISPSLHDGILELHVEGRLDAYWADQLCSDVMAAVQQGHSRIGVNLVGVDFISSAGIGALMRCYKELRGMDGAFFVTEASSTVREVLALTKVDAYLAAPSNAANLATQREQAATQCSDGFEVQALNPQASRSCRIIQQQNGSCTGLRFDASSIGLGLGALGSDSEQYRERVGEFVAAGGAVAYLPTDGGNVPDFLLATGDLVPQLQAASGLYCPGEFSHELHFDCSNSPLTIEKLTERALQTVKSESVALAILAEVDALVGATAKKSPMQARSDTDPLSFPAIRDWMSFTPERSFVRTIALVVGVATTKPGKLSEYVRPLGTTGLSGHFHAIVFPYRPLRRGRVVLQEMTRVLFESERPITLLHLLNDDRPVVGSGQSTLIRGNCWCSPITAITREAN